MSHRNLLLKSQVISSIFIVLLLLLSPLSSYAKAGCCSHHGGVAGCDTATNHQQCRDGSDSPSCSCNGTTAPAMDALGDGVIYGPSLPTYYGGFNNTFRYKGIDLYVNIVYSGGNKIYNGTKATLLDNRFFNNQVDILRRWTTPGQITDIPAVHYNDQQASGSVLPNSYNVEDGSYIKLGNAQLGYTFPATWYGKTGITSIRIYGSASNIILHTKYTGSDPEISANGDSNTASGRDKNSVPAGKSFTFGLNVGF